MNPDTPTDQASDPVEFTLPGFDTVEIFQNEGGGITIQQYSVESEPSRIVLPPDQALKLFEAAAVLVRQLLHQRN